MDFIRVTAKISNPSDSGRAEEITLLVDTGATLTVVPKGVLQRLGIPARGTRSLRTADGRVVERQRSLALIEVQGVSDEVPLIFGEASDVPVLGVTALEILGFELDPIRGELKPSEFLYL